MTEIAYIPTVPGLREQIQQLNTGDTLLLPAGYVRRVKPKEFTLHAAANRNRNRWGTLEEITEDTAYFLQWGALPKAQGGPW